MNTYLKNSLLKPKFCVSIAISNSSKLNSTIAKAFTLGAHMAEIRLDSLTLFSIKQINQLSHNYKNRLILTFRNKNQGGFSNISESERLEILTQLLEIKYSIKDIESDTFLKNYSLFNNERNLIVSWHNFKSTPSTTVMTNLIQNISNKLTSARQIIKIATYANTLDDCNKIFSLYSKFRKSKFQLLAFCMSDTGSMTRILSPMFGAPFVYCFMGNKSVAPGQVHINTLKKIYANFS